MGGRCLGSLTKASGTPSLQSPTRDGTWRRSLFPEALGVKVMEEVATEGLVFVLGILV